MDVSCIMLEPLQISEPVFLSGKAAWQSCAGPATGAHAPIRLYQYGRQRRVIGSWKMYKDGSASVAHSLLLLLTHRHKQSYTWTACALLEKAHLTHRRKGSCISPEPAVPNPSRLSRDAHKTSGCACDKPMEVVNRQNVSFI